MIRTFRIAAAAVLAALTMASLAPLTRAAEPDSLRATVAAKARAAGVEPSALFARTLTVGQPQPDGTLEPIELTVGEVVDQIDGSGARGTGPAGTPEIVAGDTLHAWVSIGTGSQLLDVSESALVPATPPVILPPPATLLAFDAGGTLKHINGSYTFGIHTVGTLAGSNVSTDQSGDLPVWLPVVTTGIVEDNSIDFLGHAVFAQAETCIPFVNLCFAAGVLLGDGVMLFDNTLPLGLPSLP